MATLFYNINWTIDNSQVSNIPNQNINWNQTGITNANTIFIEVPTDINSQEWKKLTYRASDIPTLHHLLGAIYTFYASPISTEDINLLLDTDIDDAFGYIANAATKIRAGQQVPYIDLMGDLKLFKGLIPNRDRNSDLLLGSYDLWLGS